MFSFSGNVILSKSWLNRLQIIKYFNPSIELEFTAESDDAKFLQSAIGLVGKDSVFDLGQGGTSLRFFIFLISRQKGEWTLNAHPSLLARPQLPLKNVLEQLGVSCELLSDRILITSQGWKVPDLLTCPAEFSSQFISGLLLSCWGLEQDIRIAVNKPIASFDYLKMTAELLRSSGMNLRVDDEKSRFVFSIPREQRAKVSHLQPEPDMSSIFSLASASVVAGSAEILNWSSNTLQPDASFTQIFQKMGIDFQKTENVFKISKCKSWRAVTVDLNSTPDLFPVLAALCALAEGDSVLNGAAQLRQKESNRISKTKELLLLCGYNVEELSDGLKIFGRSSTKDKSELISFDPSEDHRMAMAAALFKLFGFNIVVKHPEVVNKSYPTFWQDVGL